MERILVLNVTMITYWYYRLIHVRIDPNSIIVMIMRPLAIYAYSARPTILPYKMGVLVWKRLIIVKYIS